MDDQVIATLGVWALLGLLLQGPVGAPPIAWPLLYEGKSTNEIIGDNRMRQLVNTRVPAALSHDVLEGLIGPPDPVVVTDHRYVSASACVPHFCPMKAFFWLDTRTGAGLGAHFVKRIGDEPAKLRLGSNGLSVHHIPRAARAALADWISEEEINPETVQFIGRDGTVSTLMVTGFQPRVVFAPPPGGPSFDCAHASGLVERAICHDPGLARLDLALFKLADWIRRGHDTTVARTQLTDLQRAWKQKRDTDCASASELAACLAEHYRAQDSLLQNWTPSR